MCCSNQEVVKDSHVGKRQMSSLSLIKQPVVTKGYQRETVC